MDKRDEYVFDGLDPVAEYNMLNGQHTDYYRGAGNHLALMHQYKGGTQGQMYWYHYNNKGDVAGLTKHNGNSHHNYRYDPYGAVLPENGNFTDPHNHYTLTGKEFDENTGLVWFGARHYEPETGVWMGQDIYRGRLREPMSLHRYQYVFNNSINGIDFYGLDAEFRTRPLEALGPVKTGYDVGTHVLSPSYVMLDLLNKEVLHEHIFLTGEANNDEDDINIGFGPDGFFSEEDDHKYGPAIWKYSEGREEAMIKLAIIMEAKRMVRENDIGYQFFINNCQEFASGVRRQYGIIEKNKDYYRNILNETNWLNDEVNNVIDNEINSIPVIEEFDIYYIEKMKKLPLIYPSDPGYIDLLANYV